MTILWIVLLCLVVAVLAFAGGYLVGVDRSEADLEHALKTGVLDHHGEIYHCERWDPGWQTGSLTKDWSTPAATSSPQR